MKQHGKKQTHPFKRLHGWDDEKIYFTDGGSGSYCVSDDKELYEILEMICDYWLNKKRKKKK